MKELLGVGKQTQRMILVIPEPVLLGTHGGIPIHQTSSMIMARDGNEMNLPLVDYVG